MSDYLDASGITDAGLPDEYLDLDELDLPRSTAPQCEHPPVDCTAECRGVRARSTVARILVTLGTTLVALALVLALTFGAVLA
ncbi:DUF4190 domain-containing protein [Mycobacterium phage KanikaMF1]|nr:DUF4190 domain-containing protein [Mycobacterium phage KanikaMF1]WLG15491.1 hypothetical protein MTBP_35 [Mycobacterium phage MTBP1]